MRCSTKVLFRKFNQFRKQNWSAPTTMSVFIIICMICIFSLESLGILNKEKNLNFRFEGPETSIKLIHEEILENKEQEVSLSSSVNFDFITTTKEEKIMAINDILLRAADSQIKYELTFNKQEDLELKLLYQNYFEEEEELKFFDI